MKTIKSKPAFAGITQLLLLFVTVFVLNNNYLSGQTTLTYNNYNSGVWLNGINWDIGYVPTGGDIAAFASEPSLVSNVGINMNGTTNNGANNQAVGAVYFTTQRTALLQIGNSSTSANGTLTLNGVLVNTVNNVIIRMNCSANIRLMNNVGSGNKNMEIALGNAAENIIMIDNSGSLTVYPVISGTGKKLTLDGAGTGQLILAGHNTYTGVTTIKSGTLVLDTTNVIDDNSNIILSGGTLKTGATIGYDDNVGTLRLQTNSSTIALGTDVHSLKFANSSSVGWTAGKTLTITGWVGTAGASGTQGRIFVGADATGLTPTQLSQITFSGYTNGAMILPTGEIVPNCTAPVVVVTPSVAAICANGSVSLTAGGAVTYTWSPAAGLSATSGATVTASPASTTTYTVTGNSGGCVGSTNVTVTVNTSSSDPASVTASVNPVCSGNPTILTVSGGTPGTGATWKWYSGNCGGTPVGSGSTVSVSPNSNTTYFVRAEGTCNITNCVSQLITVNTLSTDPTSVTATVNPVCSGNPTILTVSGGTPGTGATWKWYSGNCGGTPIGSGSTVSVSPNSNTAYFVRAEGTCNITNCVSVTIAINQSLPAGVSISANPAGAICQGTIVTFTAIPVNGGTSPAYQWQVNGTDVPGATNSTFTSSTLVNGDIVNCVMTSNAQCATGSPATSNSIVIVVNPVTVVPVVAIGNMLSAAGGITYQWYLNGNIISGATSQTYTPLQNGVYTVEISDANGCTSTSSGYNVTWVSISEIVNGSGISIYPNPASGNITVESTLINEGIISLYSIHGKLLLQQSLKQAETLIDLSGIAEGVFVLKIETAEGMLVRKVIKE